MNSSYDPEKRIHTALQSLLTEVIPPPASMMRARAVVRDEKSTTLRPDIITAFAAFLNLRVKLAHVMIVFILFWLGYLAYQTKSSPHQEADTNNYNSDLASTTNHTVLPCIQTFILKK